MGLMSAAKLGDGILAFDFGALGDRPKFAATLEAAVTTSGAPN
jgi:hypothetical protein